MPKKTTIAIILVLLVGIVLIYGYTSSNNNNSNTVKSEVLESIKSDKIYLGLSEDFLITVNELDNNKIMAKLIMRPQFQEESGEDINTDIFKNFIGGLVSGYMALVIDEHIKEYDSIEVILYDNNNNQLFRKVFVKGEVKSLKDAGYSRDAFDLLMDN